MTTLILITSLLSVAAMATPANQILREFIVEKASATPNLASYPIFASSKRGLLHITDKVHHPGLNVQADKPVWERNGSDINWYYNYDSVLTLDNNMTFEFVPMAWGPGSFNGSWFQNNLAALKANHTNVQHVLFYNEPDREYTDGGSNTSPEDAAAQWMQYFEPLRQKYGVKLGGPATTGSPDGLSWLNQFMANCTACTVDFIPFHWYSDAKNLSLHVDAMRQTFSQPLWVTEYAPYYQAKTKDTEDMFTSVTQFLDNSTDIERYSYWGAWRRKSTPPDFNGDESMLDNQGKLTKIGGWYMHLPVESGAASNAVTGAWWIGIMAACTLWSLI